MSISKNKDNLIFISYDFRRIIKQIVLNKKCANKTINLNHKHFKMKADIICADNNVLIDTFISYKGASFSHREWYKLKLD